MAKIIHSQPAPKPTKRFTIITAHYMVIFLHDELGEKDYTIDCSNRKELNTMCLYNDTEWTAWLDSNGAWK